MNRTLTILIFAAGVLTCLEGRAQHHVGGRISFGGGTSRFNPNADVRYLWGLPGAGVSWKYYGAERVVAGVAGDVVYMQQGFKLLQPNPQNPGDTTTYRRTFNSVVIPFSWQPHVYLFDRSMRVFLNAGITVSYNFASHESLHSQDGTLIYDRDRDFQFNRDNCFGYGLMGGLGVGWLTGRMEFFAEARYYFGYSDILKNRDVYPDNPSRSPVDHVNLSVGMFYRLGRGDILSRPAAPRVKPDRNEAPQQFEGTGGGGRRR